MDRLLFHLAVIGAVALTSCSSSEPYPVFDDSGPVSDDRLGLALYAERVARERWAAENRSSDKQAQHEAFEKQALDRRLAEIEKEQRIWQTQKITSCDSGEVTGPSICVEKIGPASRPIGGPVEFLLRWRNLPEEAYIRLWVRNGAPAGERWQYRGPSGAILPDFIAASPSGSTSLQWDGQSTWCAPADAPTLCNNGEIGTFVVRAAILTGTDPFWPSWPVQNPTPVRWLALNETTLITLTGQARIFDDVPNSTFGPLNGPLGRLAPESYGIQSFRTGRTTSLGEWNVDKTSQCRTVILVEPFAGTPELCFPTSRLDQYGLKLRPWDIYAKGQVKMASGILPPGEARERAQIAAYRRVAEAARFITYDEAKKAAPENSHPDTEDSEMQRRNRAATYTSQEQVYAYFRKQGNTPYWLVTLTQAIKTLNYEEYITRPERLVYRVEMDGRTCLIRTGSVPDEGTHLRC